MFNKAIRTIFFPTFHSKQFLTVDVQNKGFENVHIFSRRWGPCCRFCLYLDETLNF